MKPASRPERVPYRRGEHEEKALAKLHSLRSADVPALGSDNRWLRFSVRLLWELWQSAGEGPLVFGRGTVGRPGGELDLREAPAELSPQLGEARLRPNELALLEAVRHGLHHPSRSAALRHALFACEKVCVAVARGDALFQQRDGRAQMLPKLRELAADLDASDSLTLLGDEARSWSAAVRRKVCGPNAVEFLESAELWSKLGYDHVDFELALAGGRGRVHVAWRSGSSLTAELVEVAATLAADGGERSPVAAPPESERVGVVVPMRRRIGGETTAPPDMGRGPASERDSALSLAEVAGWSNR